MGELESLINVQLATSLDPAFAAPTNDTWSATPRFGISSEALTVTTAGGSWSGGVSQASAVRCVRDCDGDCSAICGDGVCGGTESLATCSADCAFLANHFSEGCNGPGTACPSGYTCSELAFSDGICVADFDTWPPLPLAHTASDFSSVNANMVLDLRTGLMWAKVALAANTQSAASNACRASSLSGQSDWRLPTEAELASLIDFTTSSPATSAVGMTLTGGPVWSTTHFGTSGANVWQVNFQDGELQYADAQTTTPILCVRIDIPTTSLTGVGVRYSSDATTVFDHISGLRWQQAMDGGLDWPSANAYCAGQGGGWRLPTVVELRTIIDRSGISPCIDAAFSKPASKDFWTGSVSGGSAWTVDFYAGRSVGMTQNNKLAARCVK